VRGALLTLLLPVAAVAAVLSVLKLNIDPTAPQLLLQLPELGQAGPLMLANPPEALAACITSRHRGSATRGAWDRSSGVLGAAGGACAGALAFAEQASAGGAPLDSWEVSELLLREVYAGARRGALAQPASHAPGNDIPGLFELSVPSTHAGLCSRCGGVRVQRRRLQHSCGQGSRLCRAGGPAQYAAVVFDDPALAGIGNASKVDASQLLPLLPLLAAAAPAAQGGGGGAFGGLGGLGLGLAAGLAPVAWLASPEARVASGFLARMQTCARLARRGAARSRRAAV
jgi:hypothetical protein